MDFFTNAYTFGLFDRIVGADLADGYHSGDDLSRIELGRILSKGEIRHDIQYVFDGQHFRLLDPSQFDHLGEGDVHEIIFEFTKHYGDGSTSEHQFTFEVQGQDAAPQFQLSYPDIVVNEGAFSFLDFGFAFTDSVQVPNDYQLRVVGGVDAGLIGRPSIGFNGPENNFEFLAFPDFERPADANGDNVYDILLALFDDDVQASDPVAASVTVLDAPASALLPSTPVGYYGAIVSDLDSLIEIPIDSVLRDNENQYEFVDVSWNADSPLFWSSLVDVSNTVSMSVAGAAPASSLILNIDQQAVDDLIIQVPISVGFQATVSDGFGNEPTAFGEIVIVPADDAVEFEPPLLQLHENRLTHTESFTKVDIEADLFFGNWEKVFPLGGLFVPFPDLEIVGGTDAHLFRQPQTFFGPQFVVGERGDLLFKDAPDFNNPMDANGDNVYEVDLAFRNELVSSEVAHLFIEVVSFDPADNANPALIVGDVVPIVPGTYESIEFFL